jgi:ornithine--oxo-acid transaminase
LANAAISAEAALYRAYVNPEWSKLLNVLEMDVGYERCLGAELFTIDGRRILDFLSGYCVHNAGHNHPAIVSALHAELDRNGPAMLQSHVPELAGELAEKLLARASGRLRKVFFAALEAKQWRLRSSSPAPLRAARACCMPRVHFTD